MQEIKKRRIVLASVLKPVDDSRMFEKMAASLHQEGYQDVHIIGFPSTTSTKNTPGITIHPLPYFHRISITRIFVPWMILFQTIRLRPALFMVTTHELIVAGCLAKIFLRCSIVYDIQENYFRNIRYTNAFPGGLRYLVALWVRLKEKLLTPFFDSLIIAEKCYQHELDFLNDTAVVIENKCVVPRDFIRKPVEGITTLLFSGTLAESTGVFEAILLAKVLHTIDPSIQLHIVGHCPMRSTWKKITSVLKSHPYIHVTGGNALLPHHRIMEAIESADFGIIYYPPAPHNDLRIPTKLFEYLACGLPVLLQNKRHYTDLAGVVEGAIPISLTTLDGAQIVREMRSRTFFTKPTDSFTWDSEVGTWLQCVQNVLYPEK